VFSFNPNKVPSIRLDGERRPFCRACVAHLNTIRVAKDLPPIVPLPGAYEVADEDEIIWD
jgi:hypothetical protein